MQQSDPLRQLLFALTLQGPLEKVAAMDLAQPLAYADDTFLQGAPAPTMQAFAAFAPPLALHVQSAKCTVYSADCAFTALVASLLGVHPMVSPVPQLAPRCSRPPTLTAAPLAPASVWRSTWQRHWGSRTAS
jgi:hypothetical protein